MLDRLMLEGTRPSQASPEDRFDAEGKLLAARDWIRTQTDTHFPHPPLTFWNPRKGMKLTFRRNIGTPRWMDVTVGVGEREGTLFQFSRTTRVYSDHVENVAVELIADPSLLAPIYYNGRAWSLHELAFWMASAFYYDVNLFPNGKIPYEGLYLEESEKPPLQIESEESRPQEFVFPTGWNPSSDFFSLKTAPWQNALSRVQVLGGLGSDGKTPRIGFALRFHSNSPAGRGWTFPGNGELHRFLQEGISRAMISSDTSFRECWHRKNCGNSLECFCKNEFCD